MEKIKLSCLKLWALILVIATAIQHTYNLTDETFEKKRKYGNFLCMLLA